MTTTRQQQLTRARVIRRSLGIAVAARYLKRRGWSVEAAAYILNRRT